MTALAIQPYALEAALLMAVVWGCLACMIPLIRHRYRAQALWGTVILGVPVLGWLTFVAGPGPGVMAFALGLAMLVYPPIEALRRRRAHNRNHSQPTPAE